MTMMITKFNKLIASKLMWITFLGIIVVSFVFWGRETPDQARQSKEASSPGKLYGEFVSPDVFQAAYVNTYIGVALGAGGPIRITDELDQRIRENAWKRLVTLNAVKELGLFATDDEVIKTIQQQPSFLTEGRFNLAYYNAFVSNVLRGLGVSGTQFEEFIREQLVLNKVRYLVNQAALISPRELERASRSILDQFQIEYVVFEPNLAKEGFKITEEQVQTYFEDYIEAYTIPPKVSVKYVRFSTEEFLEEAKAQMTEEDALDYYIKNIDAFTETIEQDNTNSAETVKATNQEPDDIAQTTTNSFDELFAHAETGQAETMTKPFEDVKEEIIERLSYEEARKQAIEKAYTFIDPLTPDRDGKVPAFKEVADSQNLHVFSTVPFAVDEDIGGIDTNAAKAFTRAAFNLRATPDEYFSDVIPGEDVVYVLALEERLESRIPELEEVADRVAEGAQTFYLQQALQTKAIEIQDGVAKQLEEGKTFVEALKPYKLTPTKTEKFTVIEGIENEDYNEILMPALLVCNQGELTEILPFEDRLLLAYVSQRISVDMSTFDAFRTEVISNLAQDRGRRLFSSFQDFLLEKASFEPRREIPSQEEDGAEETVSDDDNSSI